MPRSLVFALIVMTLIASVSPSATANAQQAAPVIPNPTGRDMFQLNDLDSYRQFSSTKNFEIVGHSYLRGPWLTPGAHGAGVNTLRICGNIAYLGGYNPTVYGTLIVDVSNPTRMEPLSFIPANPGTRNAYLRADCDRKILAVGHSAWPDSPYKPPDEVCLRRAQTRGIVLRVLQWSHFAPAYDVWFDKVIGKCAVHEPSGPLT